MLRTADRALCTAYTQKTGMSENEALQMMEHETWLTAQQAKEKGLVDEVMFEEPEEPEYDPVAAGYLFKLPSKEQMERVKDLMDKEEPDGVDRKDIELANCKVNMLKLMQRRA